jgi:hypothetical protein
MKSVFIKEKQKHQGKQKKVSYQKNKYTDNRYSTENKRKEQAYWVFLQSNYATDRSEYKLKPATVKKDVRKINRQYQD